MNRQLASFDIFVIVSELQNIIGSYIDKTYQLTKDEILIKIRNVNQCKKENIFIRNGEFICRTEKNIVTPLKPTTFAMTFRKYLSNSKISSITQHEFDRIIIFTFEKGPRKYKLIIELFSQGNMMLLNEENTILLPLKRERWAHRAIGVGKEYEAPPSQINPFSLEKTSFIDILRDSNADVVRTIAVQFNVGGVYAEEICIRAGIDKNISIHDLLDDQLDTLYDSFIEFLQLFQNKEFSPVLIQKNDEIIDVLPFEFQSYSNISLQHIPQMIQGLEQFLTPSEKETKKVETKQEKKINKLKRRLSQQQAVKDADEKINLKQQHGELIYLHFKECDELLQKIQEGINKKEKGPYLADIQSHPLVESFDPQENRLIVLLSYLDGKTHTVRLDFRKSVADNAEAAYDTSKKLKQKQRGAIKAIEVTKKQLTKIQAMRTEEDSTQIQFRKTPEKSFWFERYRWSLSSNGNLILGGKDAKTNDQLIKKHLEKGDRYAHADIHGAPSCVIKIKTIENEPVEITDDALEDACIFAACYSRAWKQFMEAQAYWVLPNQVSKTPQSGEYVPKGAFIIRGKRNYRTCELRFGIGVITIDDTKKIIGGAPRALDRWCDRYVIITPGKVPITEAVKKIAQILNTTTDKVQKALPPGNITIGSVIEKKENTDS
jgi:predicted ribosome quality control (RQC) complex YloA/Tae2 family protein